MKLIHLWLPLYLILTVCFQHVRTFRANGSFLAAGSENAHVRYKRSFANQDISGSENSDGISNILQQLDIPKAPVTLQQPHSSKYQSFVLPDDSVLSDKGSKFKAKHTFQNENGQNSFDVFTANPESAQRMLLEMNRKLPYGDILPSMLKKKSFGNWFTQAAKDPGIKITIIDADYATLFNDIHPRYTEWKSSLPENYDFSETQNSFTTTSIYPLTEVSFKPIKDAEGNYQQVKVYAEKLEQQVKLGTFPNDGTLKHFAGLKAYPEKSVRKQVHVATFDMHTLEENAKMTNKLWTELKIKQPKSGLRAINEKYLPYTLVKDEYDKELDALIENKNSNIGGPCVSSKKIRQRSTRAGFSQGCGIVYKPNGDVDSIYPKEFLEVYKLANKNGKQQMAELAKNNLDKIPVTEQSTESRKKLDKLIQLEDMKSHTVSVDAVIDVHTGKKVSLSTLDFTDSILTLGKQLMTVKSKVKASFSKVSKSMSKLANSKIGKGFSQGVGTASSTLGMYFLAKSIVNGIANNDVASLAIVGTRVGYEVVTGSALAIGEKLSARAVKLGKITKTGTATKYLGRVAGPIGATADIGLSVWSLTKSVERLKNATRDGNKYDRNDAIADIVSDSVDIAVTAVVTTLSMVFPDAAPLIIAVGAVIDILNKWITSLFKAANHVARINAEIPLLESEKKYVLKSRMMDWFGTRKDDYVDHLMQEKQANDIAVQHNLKFLEDNPSFLGVVFPSRTLRYEGRCHRTVQHCALKNAWGCTRWEDKFTTGSGCDFHRPCSRDGHLCMDHIEKRGAWGYDQIKCVCDKQEKTEFDFPRKNSLVDFRSMQKIYWERAVPKDVEGADFKCKPGNTTFLDYKLHQMNSLTGYLCQNAIALLQPITKRIATQTMFFNLEDGNDQVYLNQSDPTPNLFFVGEEGYKYFSGGLGRNEFVFNGNCARSLSGVLSGGRSDRDAVTFLSSCAKGTSIKFENRMLSTPNKKLWMQLVNIEEFYGRENEQDLATVDCQLRSVALLGGRDNLRRDVVTIPHISGCAVNVTVFLGNYTTIDLKVKRGHVAIIADKQWSSVSVNLDIYPEKDLKLNVLFSSTASNQVIIQSLKSQSENISSITVKNTTALNSLNKATVAETNFNLNFSLHPKPYPYQPIYFQEQWSLYSALLLTPSTSPVFYHSLFLQYEGRCHRTVQHCALKNAWGCSRWENKFITGTGCDWHGPCSRDGHLCMNHIEKRGTWGYDDIRCVCDKSEKASSELNFPTRIGNQVIENIFQITSPNWRAIGGEKDDVFLLNSTVILEVDGRGGDDTLRLDPSINQSMTIDLAASKTFKSIENVHGAPEKPIKVICACDSKLVNTLGGSLIAKDVVIVPSGFCKHRELQIIAKGNLSVEIEDDVNLAKNNSIIVVAVASSPDDPASTPLQFKLEAMSTSVSGLNVAIQLAENNWTALARKQSPNERSIDIIMEGGNNQSVQLKFIDPANTAEPLLTAPYIQMSVMNSDEASGQLVLERETLTPKVFYQLSNETTAIERTNVSKGILGIQNVFIVHSGSWQLTGGNLDDVILLHSSAHREKIIVDGGNGSENSLILESSSPSNNTVTYGVNLETGELGFLKDTLNKGIVKNIHNVLGRIGEPDVIHASCTTKTISGRDGAGRGAEDLILISGKNCTENIQKLEIQVGKFTRVKNAASHGEFIYHISDPITSELELVTSTYNLHLIDFGFNPWEHIQNIGFDKKQSILGIKFVEGNAERVQLLNMHRENVSEEFSNPIIEFHQPGTQVTSDIRVAKDGVVAATFIIHEKGLKANESVVGLPVTINRFMVNVTKKGSVNEGGNLTGSSSSGANQFWIFQLDTALNLLDGGNCENDEDSFTNYLQFAESFENQNHLEISLDEESGNLRVEDRKLISHLKNIHELRGRIRPENVDKVTVSSCKTRQLSEIEEIFIKPSNHCTFNMFMEIGERTEVIFGDSIDFVGENLTAWMNSTFHYRFKSPRSFDLNGTSDEAWFGFGATHNYFLPFHVDDLERLWFDSEMQELHYSINGTDYHHTMIGGINFGEQFYAQPVMITEDGFKINIGQDGSILLTLGAGSSFPKDGVRSEIIPAFEAKTKELGVTIMMQTDTQFIFVGHGNAEGDRNILQNLGYSESYLVGGGANDTIYEIVDLQKDVFIYTGFDADPEVEVVKNEVNYLAKQTLDLTDIIVPIRNESGTKYVPKIEKRGTDLVISMSGYDHKYPGEIWIIKGQKNQVASKIQILLNNAIMDLVPPTEIRSSQNNENGQDKTEWKIRPRPILVPEGSIYSISKEDFEDGHEIRVENSSESNSTFNVIRNGVDLYLTNMRGRNDEEATTVMITDYLGDENSNETKDENSTLTLPSNVVDVTVSLPGLKLLLNDSKLIKSGESGIGSNAKGVINPSHIPEWNHLLHEVEEIILENMPDIERTFPCEVCMTGSSGFRFSPLYIGLACGLLAFVAVALLLVGIGVKYKSKLQEYDVQLSRLKFWNRK